MTTPSKAAFLLVVPGFIAGVFVQACGGASPAHAQAAETVDPIEGVWNAEITVRDCTSGTAVRTFRGLQVFAHGGQLVATNNTPTATQGPALGIWQRAANAGQYTSTFRFFRYNADGTLAGAQRVTRTLQLAGGKLTSSISGQILDPNDQVLQSFCATEDSSRGP